MLIGDYAEREMHHGKPSYEKTSSFAGFEKYKVMLYYWDKRDGENCSGWWFGDAVGGKRYYCHAAAADANASTPPTEGWTMLWDRAPHVPDFVLEFTGDFETAAKPAKRVASAVGGPAKKVAKTDSTSTSSAGGAGSNSATSTPLDSLQPGEYAAAEKYTLSVETDVLGAIAKAKETMDDEGASEDVYREAKKLLQAQQQHVQAAIKAVSKHIAASREAYASESVVSALAKLNQKLRALQPRIAHEGMRAQEQLKQFKSKGEQAVAAEETARAESNLARDSRALRQMQNASTELVRLAEEAVEALAAKMVPSEGDEDTSEAPDPAELQEAEASATTKVMDAESKLKGCFEEIKGFVPDIRKIATQDMDTVQERMAATSTKLRELKGKRQKQALKAALEGVITELNGADDEAMNLQLEVGSGSGAEQMTDAEIKEGEVVLQRIYGAVSEASRQVEQHVAKHMPDGNAKPELEEVQKRVKDVRLKLEGCKTSLKAQRDGLFVAEVMTEAQRLADATEERMTALPEAEAPFLEERGEGEELSEDEIAEAAAKCEEAASAAEALTTVSQKFVKEKTEATARLDASARKEIVSKIGPLNTRIVEMSRQLQDFKTRTSKYRAQPILQKTSSTVEEVEAQVKASAARVQQMQQDCLDAPIESILSRIKTARSSDLEAATKWMEARQIVSLHHGKAQDTKSAEFSIRTELDQLSKRLIAIHNEMNQCKQAVGMIERRARTKESLEGARVAVLLVEQSATDIMQKALDVKKDGSAVDDAALKAMGAEADRGLASAVACRQSLERQLAEAKSADLRQGLSGFKAQAQATADKITSAKTILLGCHEMRAGNVCVEEAEQKTVTAEKAIEEVVALTSQEGGESGAAAATGLEEATAKATSVISEATAFVGAKLAEVKKFTHMTQPALGKLEALTQRLSLAAQNIQLTQHQVTGYQFMKLMRDAEAQVARTEEDIRDLVEADRLAGAIHTAMLAEVLKTRKEETGQSMQDLFSSIAGGESGIGQDALRTFLEGLPDLTKRDDLAFSPEHCAQIFRNMDVDKDGVVNANDFEALVLERFVCAKGVAMTTTAVIADGKTLAKLEPAEIVEWTGETHTEAKAGVQRMLCRRTQDRMEGWVTTVGNQGTRYLEPCNAYAAVTVAADSAVEAACKIAAKVSDFVRTNAMGLSKLTKDSPQPEIRKSMLELKGRTIEILHKVDRLRTQVGDAKASFPNREAAEKWAVQGVKDRRMASVLMNSVQAELARLDAAEGELQAAVPSVSADDTAALRAALPTPISWEAQITSLARKVTECVSAVKKEAHKHMPALTGATKGPLFEAKTFILSVITKLDVADKRKFNCLATAKSLSEALVNNGLQEVSTVLREQIREDGVTVTEAFEKLAGVEGGKPDAADSGGVFLPRIPEETMVQRMQSLSFEPPITQEQATFFCRRLDHGGLGRVTFARWLEKYYVCLKTIAITESFDIAGQRPRRRLDPGEMVELLEGPCHYDKLGISRIRGRALCDGAVAWVSVQGKSGTAFLAPADKPCIACLAACSDLRQGQDVSSDIVRKTKSYEVFEVLEGPTQVNVTETRRVKCTARRDGAEGWFTITDRSGNQNAEPCKAFYVCKSSIAITDHRTIKTCKVLRKLAVNEVFKLLEGPYDEGGVQRVKAFILKDNLAAWVTLKGNQGSVYAEEAKGLCEIVRETELQSGINIGEAESVRALSVGEAVELSGDPQGDGMSKLSRLRVRAFADGAVGWITAEEQPHQTWTPQHRCQARTPLLGAEDDGAGGSGEGGLATLRHIEAGEVVELFEGPEQDEHGALYTRCRTTKDGLSGVVLMRGGGESTMRLVPAPRQPRLPPPEPASVDAAAASKPPAEG